MNLKPLLGNRYRENRYLYQQLPLLIRSPNKTFLGGAKGCRVALEWSKLMRFNINAKKFLSAADTLIITYNTLYHISMTPR